MTEKSIELDDLEGHNDGNQGFDISLGLSPRDEKFNALIEQYNSDNGFIDEVLVDDVNKSIHHNAQNLNTENIYQNDDGQTVLKLKVNGKVVEKQLEQAIVELQKSESADARLREAAEQRKQLDDYANRLAIEAQALDLKRAHSEKQYSDRLSIDDTKTFVNEIFNGNQDDAAEKLLNLISNNKQQNPDLIADIAAKRAVAEMSIINSQQRFNDSIEVGKQWLYENHAEAMQDADIANFINYKTAEISRVDPNLTPEQVIKRAATEVLSKFNMMNGNNSESNLSAREMAKQNLPKPIVRQSNSTRVSQTFVEETPQDIAARMRAERASIRNHNY
jgi:hypothetical protein